MSFNRAELARAADAPSKGGPETVAGRALQKHAPSNLRRPTSPFPESTGNPRQVAGIAKQIVDEILANDATAVYVYRNRFIHARPPAPDRRVIRWRLGGTFEAFLELP